MTGEWDLVERLYEAADNARLLPTCTWRPPGGGPPHVHPVGLAAPDETLMDGLTLSTEYLMSYPASRFEGLKAGERVEVDGVAFKIRDVRAVSDGSERRARLTRW